MRKFKKDKDNFSLKDFIDWMSLLSMIAMIVLFILGVVVVRDNGSLPSVKGDVRYTFAAIAVGIVFVIINSKRGD